MFANAPRRRLILPIAPTAGGAIGLLVALAVALMPGGLLDSLADASHVPSLLAAAAPPLGATARAVLVLVGGGGAALVVGLGLRLTLGNRTVTLPARPQQGDEAGLPVLRRADAHPDAPARRLVRAHRDLGAPPPSVREVALPADLDQPLAAYDPAAILEMPREPARAVAPLVRLDRPQLIDPGDRFETFDLVPLGAEIEPTATIHALLDRLERGLKPKAATPGLDQALGELRLLAS